MRQGRTGSQPRSRRSSLFKNRRISPLFSNYSSGSLKIEVFLSPSSSPLTNIVSKEKTLEPVTTLDPQTALIVVDLQKSLVASPFIDPLAELIERTQTLPEAFRRLELPLVLVNVDGGAPGPIEQPRNPIFRRRSTGPLRELGRQPSDIALTQRTSGAPASTGLEAQLRAHGATQVVIAGVATGTGVEARAHRHVRRDSTLLWPWTP